MAIVKYITNTSNSGINITTCVFIITELKTLHPQEFLCEVQNEQLTVGLRYDNEHLRA